MNTLQRSVLGFMAVCLVAIWAYALSYWAYGVLDSVPADWVWAGGMAIMLSLYLAFAKRVLKHIKELKHDDPTPAPSINKEAYDKFYDDMMRIGAGMDAYKEQEKVDHAMEELESDVHGWITKGDTPGSLAGSVIALDAVDVFLEGLE